ncbi:MAG: matrixin family metalloprotease [Candidatus Binatia bacterium]
MAFAGLLVAEVAFGTTFILMDDETLLHSSDVVVVGTVTAIESGGDPGGPIYTYVHVLPERVIKGPVGLDPVVLREPGGSTGERVEWVYGVPEFSVGERSLLFLSRNPDGTLQTHSLAMGKYALRVDATGRTTAVRDLGFGASVFIPSTGDLVDAPRHTQRFLPLLRRLRKLAHNERPRSSGAPPITLVPHELARIPTRFQDAFTFLGSPPGRWFQPDSGQPVTYLIDSTGDAALGFATSRAAVDAGLSAWSNLPASDLTLQDSGTTAPGAFNQCSINRIVFNDPSNELTHPTNCGGVLALGGYCTGGGTKVVNGTSFAQIVVGKITFNSGWGSCSIWNQCNLAEVATHELGHTIGLGHSTDTNATMYAMAHFDGRCAAVTSDDIAGVNAIYPAVGAPTRTNTPPPSPTRTPPPTSTKTTTPSPNPTATQTVTPIPPATPTPTATTAPVPVGVSGQISYYGNALPVTGATVELQGSVPAAVQTDTNGQFAFADITPGNWQIQPAKTGDMANGVDILDAVSILEATTGIRTLSAKQQLACDVSGDGTVDIIDAVLILQYTVGLTTRFPVAQNCNSDWAFVPEPAAAPNAVSFPPLIGGTSCQSGAIGFLPLTGEAGNQNFSAVLFGDCTGHWQPAGSGAVSALVPVTQHVRLGRMRAVPRTHNLRAPIYVDVEQPFHALEIELRYDPTTLRPVTARLMPSTGQALLASNLIIPGTVRLALASSQPISASAVAMVEFEPLGTQLGTSADIVHAAVGVE